MPSATNPIFPLAVATALLIAPSLVRAQGAAAPALSLDAAIAQARQHHPSLQAAQAELRASDSLATVAALRPNPTLETEVENFGGTGPYKGTQMAETTVGVSVPVELGGKRNARIAVANAERDIARIGVARTDAELIEQVTIAYTQVVSADQRLLIERDHLSLAEQGAAAAHKRVDAGKASPIEGQRADVEQMNAQVALESAQRAAVTSRADLARLTGLTDVGAVDTTWFSAITPNNLQSSGPNLSVAASEAELGAASARLRDAQSQRTPDLNVGVGSRRLAETGDTALVFRVSLPIPIFNSGRSNVVAARAQVDQADANRRAALLAADTEIARAQAELADAAASAKALNGPVLAAAQETARIARIGYAEGKFSQLDLIDAERTLAETRDNAVAALTTYHLAEARLARLQAPPTSPAE